MIWGKKNFSQIADSLVPKKRNPPKFQLEMAALVESLKTMMESMATQFVDSRR